MNPTEISHNNPVFKHLYTHQKKYLLILMLLVFSSIFIIHAVTNRPFIYGQESYYHLRQASTVSLATLHYYPLHLAHLYLGDFVAFIPPILGILCFFLFFSIIKQSQLSKRFTFFFLLFLILSPAFIFAFTTISAYAFLSFILLLGFYLLTTRASPLAIIPFLLATFIDLYSSLLTIIILFMFWKQQKKAHWFIPILAIAAIINKFLLGQPWILGPFQSSHIIVDLISDLGGTSGFSFFLLLITIIGLSVTWKRKEFYLAYALLPLTIVYIWFTNTIYLVTLLAVFFATVGFTTFFRRKWNLSILKKYTFLLVVLGLLFSTLTYLDRVSKIGPSDDDFKALAWMKENIDEESIVFSTPDRGYEIRLFAQRTPYQEIHERNKVKTNQTNAILQSTYITELFPLIEQNEITHLYLPTSFRQNANPDQGVLFLLKNENFKLLFSSGETEVWMYDPR